MLALYVTYLAQEYLRLISLCVLLGPCVWLCNININFEIAQVISMLWVAAMAAASIRLIER